MKASCGSWAQQTHKGEFSKSASRLSGGSFTRQSWVTSVARSHGPWESNPAMQGKCSTTGFSLPRRRSPKRNLNTEVLGSPHTPEQVERGRLCHKTLQDRLLSGNCRIDTNDKRAGAPQTVSGRVPVVHIYWCILGLLMYICILHIAVYLRSSFILQSRTDTCDCNEANMSLHFGKRSPRIKSGN